MAIVLYVSLDKTLGPGIADIEAQQISFEPIPNKIQIVYQVPLRASHGLRTTPYTSVPTGIISPSSFTILFRIMPIIKGLNEEVESMVFYLRVKPILSNGGAVRIIPRYPEQLQVSPLLCLLIMWL